MYSYYCSCTKEQVETWEVSGTCPKWHTGKCGAQETASKQEHPLPSSDALHLTSLWLLSHVETSKFNSMTSRKLLQCYDVLICSFVLCLVLFIFFTGYIWHTTLYKLKVYTCYFDMFIYYDCPCSYIISCNYSTILLSVFIILLFTLPSLQSPFKMERFPGQIKIGIPHRRIPNLRVHHDQLVSSKNTYFHSPSPTEHCMNKNLDFLPLLKIQNSSSPGLAFLMWMISIFPFYLRPVFSNFA